MSGLANRPTLDSIRTLPIGEVAGLPAAHLALLQEDAAAALEASKKTKDWIDGAIALRFADHVQALRREAGKDTGTVRFEQDGVTVSAPTTVGVPLKLPPPTVSEVAVAP